MTFKEKVYSVVLKIPKGKVMTYKEVATRAGNSRAFRAVGNILNRSSGLPCHRVIKSDGSLGGYNRGSSQKIKKLREEGYLK